MHVCRFVAAGCFQCCNSDAFLSSPLREGHPLWPHDVRPPTEMGCQETRSEVLPATRRLADWEQWPRWISVVSVVVWGSLCYPENQLSVTMNSSYCEQLLDAKGETPGTLCCSMPRLNTRKVTQLVLDSFRESVWRLTSFLGSDISWRLLSRSRGWDAKNYYWKHAALAQKGGFACWLRSIHQSCSANQWLWMTWLWASISLPPPSWANGRAPGTFIMLHFASHICMFTKESFLLQEGSLGACRHIYNLLLFLMVLFLVQVCIMVIFLLRFVSHSWFCPSLHIVHKIMQRLLAQNL